MHVIVYNTSCAVHEVCLIKWMSITVDVCSCLFTGSFITIKNPYITLHGGSGGVGIERYSPSYCNGELSSKPS